MDFDINPEQQQLADAIRRWSEKDYGFEQRKHIIESDVGVSDAAWQAMAELGLMALAVPDEQGGFNGSALDMMVVMQELGRVCAWHDNCMSQLTKVRVTCPSAACYPYGAMGFVFVDDLQMRKQVRG
jgi:alkylation response protein AidB-like acyl-CoA dehydrogenase